MNARRLMSVAVAGTGLALVAGTVPAYADTSPSPAPSPPAGAARTCAADRLSYVQARVDAAVKKRLVTIDRLTTALAARPHVSDAHRATLSATYTSDTSGLTAVDAKVQADTTCGQAVADGRTVVTATGSTCCSCRRRTWSPPPTPGRTRPGSSPPPNPRPRPRSTR